MKKFHMTSTDVKDGSQKAYEINVSLSERVMATLLDVKSLGLKKLTALTIISGLVGGFGPMTIVLVADVASNSERVAWRKFANIIEDETPGHRVEVYNK